MSNKNIFTIVGIVVAVLVIAGLIYWQKQRSSEVEEILQGQKAGEDLNQALEQVTNFEIIPQSNPLEKLPETNPLDKVNPFKGAKTNPFK